MLKTGIILAPLALVGALAFGWGAESPNSQLLIEPSTLAEILTAPDVRVVDARPPEEYRLGHIPGAVNLPATATDSLDANRQGSPIPIERAKELFRAAGINKGSRVVVYDDQGNRFSARLFYVLEFFGHRRVQVLNGGIGKWQSEGRPMTANLAAVAPGDFEPVPNPSVIASAEWVAHHLDDPGVKLVDARSPEEYQGDVVRGPRGGHIPGATNIEWTRTLAPGSVKSFLTTPQLEQLFSEAQVTREQEVVAYCQMGMRAADIYFALRLLGYPRVRMYDGSWAEWSADPALPVEK